MYAYSEDRKGFDVSHFLSIFMGDYGYAVCVGRFEVWSMKFEDTHTNRVSNTFSAKSRLRQKTKPTIFSFSFQCKFENVEGDEDTRTQGKKNGWNSMSEQDGWKEYRAILKRSMQIRNCLLSVILPHPLSSSALAQSGMESQRRRESTQLPSSQRNSDAASQGRDGAAADYATAAGNTSAKKWQDIHTWDWQ